MRNYAEFRALKREVSDNVELAEDYRALDSIDRARMLYTMSRRMVNRYISTHPMHLKRANGLLRLIEQSEKRDL